MRNMNRMKKLSIFCILVLVLCFGKTQATAAVKVSKIKVTSPTGKTVYVAKGKTRKLKVAVAVKPNKKANKAVTYKTSRKKIATVSKKGVVKGKKIGTAKITVTSKKNKKKKATITVKVVAPIKSVTLNKSSVTLETGKTFALKTSVKPAKKVYKKISYTSSNKSVATVSDTGLIKAVAKGSAVITAKTKDGTNKMATCKVLVNAKQVQNTYTIPTEYLYTRSSEKLYFGIVYFTPYVDAVEKAEVKNVPEGVTTTSNILIGTDDVVAMKFHRTSEDVHLTNHPIYITVTGKNKRVVKCTVYLSTPEADKIKYTGRTTLYAPIGAERIGYNPYESNLRECAGVYLGGSSDYKLEIISNSYGFTIEGYKRNTFGLIGNVYSTIPRTITVKCTDVNNPSLTCTTKFTIQGYEEATISGYMVGKNGQKLDDFSGAVYLHPLEDVDGYEVDYDVREDGTYVVYGRPGKSYILEAYNPELQTDIKRMITFGPAGTEKTYLIK